jgi:hypothetical protein
MADPTFDMDFETQNDFPRLDFNLPPFPKHSDKMGNPLQLSSLPGLERSLNDTLFSRPFSPVTASFSSPSRRTAALQTPQLPMWNGNPNQPPPQSAAQCIRTLSELSISLYEHSTTIPSLSIHDPIPENELYQETMENRVRDYAYYSVDETFRLTQELIDVYPSFIDVFMRRKISHSSDSPNVATSSRPYVEAAQPVEHLGPVAPPLSSPLHLDHSSILLILSCHLRLIDIYEQLLKHMKVCIDQKGLVCTNQQASFKPPQLKIGNYVPPMETAVPMQMLLLLHFANSLRDHAVQLESHIREPENRSGSSASLPSDRDEDRVKVLSQMSAEMVKERAAGMLQHLTFLRTLMLNEGLLA